MSILDDLKKSKRIRNTVESIDRCMDDVVFINRLKDIGIGAEDIDDLLLEDATMREWIVDYYKHKKL